MIEVLKRRLYLLSGRAHPELAQAIADQLGTELGKAKLANFANGEISCRFDESIRGSDVFIIQSHSGSVNDAIMEQVLMIDAAKRASVRSITAVCPFLSYARQDRKSSGREPIAARLIIDLLAADGANRIMIVDIHSVKTKGFFNCQFDHMIAMTILIKYLL